MTIRDPRIGYKTSTRSKTEGVAKTRQISKKGTVTVTEHWDGSQDAEVRPTTVGAKTGVNH